MKLHWTAGSEMQRDPTGFILFRTSCRRWVTLNRTTVPTGVTCKQCRRYLDKLIAG